jgi:hypothetical protein
MSFRKKHREAKGAGVQVVTEQDSKQEHAEAQSEQQPAAQPAQQSGQEAGQPPEQSNETSAEQPSSEDKDDTSDDAEPVPDGTTAEILRWVGDDKGRAVRALEKERADDRPRAGLTGELNKILG